jgi:hypothetical protein
MIRDAIVIHVSAKNGEIVVPLAQTINIKGYALGLLNVSGYLRNWNSSKRSLYLCVDLVRDSFVNEVMLPVVHVLATCNRSNVIADISNPIWLKTNREYVNTVHIYLTDEKGTKQSFSDSLLRCSLVLIPPK